MLNYLTKLERKGVPGHFVQMPTCTNKKLPTLWLQEAGPFQVALYGVDQAMKSQREEIKKFPNLLSKADGF